MSPEEGNTMTINNGSDTLQSEFSSTNGCSSAAMSADVQKKRVENSKPLGRISCYALISIIPASILASLLIVSKRSVSEISGFDPGIWRFILDAQPETILLFATLSTISLIASCGCTLQLCSFLISYRLILLSEHGHLDALPTSYEFALIIELLRGRFGAWFSTVRYCLSNSFTSKKSPVCQLLLTAFSAATGLICLSILVVVIDILLHFSAQAESLQHATFQTQSPHLWGRALGGDCGDADPSQDQQGFQIALNSVPCASRIDLLIDGGEADLTANNQSSLNQVLTFQDSGVLIAALTDANVSLSEPYIATSFGVSTGCAPIGQDCEIDLENATVSCPNYSFSGSISRSILLGYNKSTSNEYGFVAAANIIGASDDFNTYMDDSNAEVSRDASSLTTIFECTSKVYNIEYSQLGLNFRVISLTDANSTTTSLTLSPMFPDLVVGVGGFGSDLLESQITSAATTAKSCQDLANTFGTLFSQTALSSIAEITTPIPATGSFTTSIVTVVSKPLFILMVALTYLYVAVALGIAVSAVIAARKPGVPDILARLNTVDLALNAFNSKERNPPLYHTRGFPIRELTDARARRVKIGRGNDGAWEALPE